MIKIITVVGARPQFIKSAAISRAIKKKYNKELNEIIIHSGQHYDANMSDVFFKELEIPKEKYNLNVGSANHAHQTAQIMEALDKVVETENPDAILLYGDTNSTLAGCLVGIKRHIPVIHVEAGVRSYNKLFPEEVNRLICDHTSSLLFVPTVAGIEALKKEGFLTEYISLAKDLVNTPIVCKCGDIMYDNTLFLKDKADGQLKILQEKYNLPTRNYFLVTSHRPSNVDDPENLENILRFFHYAIDTLSKSVIFPIHPRTKKTIEASSKLSDLMNKNGIFAIPPVSFIEMIGLEKYADIVITDSGGVQKEAYFMEKPCLIMLEETPWTELAASGNAKLVGNNYNLLCEGANYFLQQTSLTFPQLYGDGNSADYICKTIIESLSR